MGKVSSEGDVQKWCHVAHCFSSKTTLPVAAVWMCSRWRTGTQRGASGGRGLGGTVPPVRGPWAAQSDMAGTPLL